MTSRNRHIEITDRVLSRLKLKQLRLLIAIAHRSSILHAARDLNISQSSATKLLQDLEHDFDAPLFERTNRGVVPTVFGEALVRRSKLVMAQISHAAQELDDIHQGAGGRIQVGTLLAASAILLPRAIAMLHQQRPNVSVTIREGTNDVLMPALRDGDLDLVVGRLPEFRHRSDLVQERLVDEMVCIVAGPDHRLASRPEVAFADLAEYDWILPPHGTTLRRQIEQEFSDRNLPEPNCAVESLSFLTNRSLLISTDLIGALPFHVVEDEIKNGKLAILGCEMKRTAGPIGVSYRHAGAMSPAAGNFLNLLREVAAETESAFRSG